MPERIAGVVDQNIEPARLFDKLVYDAVGVLFLSEVALQDKSPCAQRDDFIESLPCFAGAGIVVHANGGAGGCQSQGSRAANAYSRPVTRATRPVKSNDFKFGPADIGDALQV